MSTLDATFSMLEIMPKDDQEKVFQYTRQLYTSQKSSNPFVPLTADQILADLEESRKQAAKGKCRDMEEALSEMGKRHGFV